MSLLPLLLLLEDVDLTLSLFELAKEGVIALNRSRPDFCMPFPLDSKDSCVEPC